MGNYIDWNVRIRRADGKGIERNDLKLFSSCVREGGYFDEDDVWTTMYCVNSPGVPSFREVSFSTESYYAYDGLNSALQEFTADHPEYFVQTEAMDCDSIGYWRTNFANGRMEHMNGYMTYDEPKEVFF